MALGCALRGEESVRTNEGVWLETAPLYKAFKGTDISWAKWTFDNRAEIVKALKR